MSTAEPTKKTIPPKPEAVSPRTAKSKEEFAVYRVERKVKNRKAKEEVRGKYFYANGAFAKQDAHNNSAVPGDLKNKILCGDSLNVLRQMPDNCTDLVFTSPPYNFGLEYGTASDAMDWEQYFKQLFAVLDECIRVLKHGGRLVVNVQPLFSDYIPSHHLISKHLMDRGLIWKGEILWEKNNYNCKYTAWGSWNSPSSPYLKYTWEFIEVFCKGGLKKEGDKQNIDITIDEFKTWVLAKWSVAPERNMKKYGHPAMFPEEIANRVLKLFSFRGDFILDPFNGAGTTTLVANKTGRNYLGIDISQEYCDIAEQRIKEGNLKNSQMSLQNL